MITIMQSGNLGNHLFQFAFGLSAAKKNKTDFVFNTIELEKYFELEPYNSWPNKKVRLLRYMLSIKFKEYKNIDLSQDEKPEVIFERVENNAVIYGYFQSATYFKQVALQVRKALTIKEKLRENYFSKYAHIFKKQVICISIRLTDYKDWRPLEIGKNSPFIDIDYYKKALSLIPNLESKNLIFTSDDIETVRKEFKYDNAFYMESVTDSLISLVHANQLIISNSTFHWWGAWLNQIPDKIVYAPKYWLGHKVKSEFPRDIIPSDWIQLDV
jgi:hypothetical protein